MRKPCNVAVSWYNDVEAKLLVAEKLALAVLGPADLVPVTSTHPTKEEGQRANTLADSLAAAFVATGTLETVKVEDEPLAAAGDDGAVAAPSAAASAAAPGGARAGAGAGAGARAGRGREAVRDELRKGRVAWPSEAAEAKGPNGPATTRLGAWELPRRRRFARKTRFSTFCGKPQKCMQTDRFFCAPAPQPPPLSLPLPARTDCAVAFVAPA